MLEALTTAGGILLVLLFGGVWGASVLWAYQDDRRRGKPAWLVALLVIVLPWPAGLLAWLVFRPAGRPGASPDRRRTSWWPSTTRRSGSRSSSRPTTSAGG
jgi:hypothetical protein